jgi:hypothetical protein
MPGLTTVANVKSYFALTVAADDALLGRMIEAVSQFISAYCDRTFSSTSHTYVCSGTGASRLMLPEAPVTAIASLTIDGAAILPRAAVGGAGYVRVGQELLLDGGLRFPKGIANVQVVYTAGFTAIPADLDQAACECVASWYKRKSRIDETSKTIEGQTFSFSQAEMPKTARAIVDTYRRTWPRC